MTDIGDDSQEHPQASQEGVTRHSRLTDRTTVAALLMVMSAAVFVVIALSNRHDHNTHDHATANVTTADASASDPGTRSQHSRPLRRHRRHVCQHRTHQSVGGLPHHHRLRRRGAQAAKSW